MRALVFSEQGLEIERAYPMPIPGDGEALIRVVQAGICNTDLEITRGYKGFHGVLGHEFVGIVEEIGGAVDRKEHATMLGKRVVGEINIPCRQIECAYCRHEVYSHCPRRTALGIIGHDGIFAEYATLPLANLHLVPDEVSDDEAVFVEPLAANFEMLEQMHILPSERVLVLGDGKMGQLAARVLVLSGCEVLMVGKHTEKLALVAGSGVKTLALEDAEQLVQQGERSAYVVECTGSARGLEMALRLVRPRGTIMLKSTVAEPGTLDFSTIVVNEIRVQGSRCGPFEPALRALRQKRIDVSSLISARYTLDEAVAAFQFAVQRGNLKVLLTMEA
ncbi:MDR/zinc-dependent alcohol dehydrogenase-like family protein [Ktedonospora formicarum]|uniref:Alcohol dehydrogenase n=1 Tax=Ktedonospora formicarum TaxID=2778364 RepID=A0A8J3MR67_9CHLR|nr:alcohol dehydrogenase catalytic domain-containing protein [Ktedonospora formicarum]GHO44725.1 alcohol dehydrogenase [Ktedonospora formicarum]